MNTESTEKDFKFYYKYLMKTFGHADCKGCRALAYALYMYEPDKYLGDIYKEYAEDISSTPSAVERSVRVYLDCIIKDYSLNDIATMLDYAFKPGQTGLKAAEFIPVLKLALEDEC